MFERWTRDVAVDFGTSNVLVYVAGRGIALEEPSVVAIDLDRDCVAKVGRDAMELLGRAPEHMEALRPMRDGSISRYEVTLQMLRYFIRRACGKVWIPPRVLICVPGSVTDIEARAVLDAAREAGARRAYLIEEPKAAALGAGLAIRSPVGSMVLNIGGGVSNVAVLSMGRIVVSDSIRIGGDKFDEAIMGYVRRRYGMLIGERTAEEIKIRIGEVYEHERPLYLRVRGRSLSDGRPCERTLSSKEMIEALTEPLTAILDSVCSVIERTPPELVGDILRNGMVLTGGGSLLRGLDRLIGRVTKVPAVVAREPTRCVARGAGRMLPYLGSMPEGMVSLSSFQAPPRDRPGGAAGGRRKGQGR